MGKQFIILIGRLSRWGNAAEIISLKPSVDNNVCRRHPKRLLTSHGLVLGRASRESSMVFGEYYNDAHTTEIPSNQLVEKDDKICLNTPIIRNRIFLHQEVTILFLFRFSRPPVTPLLWTKQNKRKWKFEKMRRAMTYFCRRVSKI